MNRQDAAVGLVIVFVIFLMLNRVFKGVSDVFGSADEEEAAKRALFPELYDSDASEFDNATPAQWADTVSRLASIGIAAAAIKEAPGMVNDDEAAIAAAFRMMRTRLDVLALNNAFRGLFGWNGSTPTGPEIGVFLDGVLSDAEWLPIVRHLETLPKYGS